MTIERIWEPIPGETPIDDVSGLLVHGISTRRQLNQVEAENIAAAFAKYLVGRLLQEEAPFTFAWMFDVHKEMFGKVWSWAGTPRKCDLNLGVPWPQVEEQVLDLVQTIPYWHEMPVLEQTARLHHRAVKIHPFLNGNGRWSRLLANIWLRLHGERPTEWPSPKWVRRVRFEPITSKPSRQPTNSVTNHSLTCITGLPQLRKQSSSSTAA